MQSPWYPGAGYVKFTYGVDNGSGTFSGVMANDQGTASYCKVGTGTQTLSGVNTYTGGTIISAGTVIASVASSLGTGGGVSLTGTLNLTGGASTNYTGINTLSGAGTINITVGTGAQEVDCSAATDWSSFTGTMNIGVGASAGAGHFMIPKPVGSAATINVLTHGTLYSTWRASNVTYNGTVVLNGGDTGESLGQLRLEVGATWAGPVVLAGTISGSGDGFIGNSTGNTGTISGIISETGGARNLSKVGAGTIILTGVNTYTGTTTVTLGTLTIGGAGSLGSGTYAGNISFASGTTFKYSSSAAQTLSGIISGAGALTKDTSASSVLTLSNTNTYTGVTTMTAGTISVATIGDGGAAGNLGQATNAAGNIVFNGGTLQYTGATASTDRNFTINAATTGTIDITTNTLTMSGADTATTGALTKIGSGALILSGTNLHTGATTVTAGTLLVNGSLASGSAVAVNSGGTLGGTGTVNGAITLVTGGTIAPGAATGVSVGILATAGVTCTGGTYSADLDGTTPTFDQINSSGTVALGSGLVTLTVANIANAAAGKTYTIVNATTAVSGTFSGMANGATFTQATRTFQTIYGSKTVKLIDCTGVATSTKVWNGGGSDSNWSTGANWVGGLPPIPGDNLQFAGSTQLTNVNDYAAGTSFNSITLSVGGGAWVISGNALALSGGATAFANNETSNTSSFAPNITFTTAAPTIAVASGGTLQLTGTIATGGFVITANPTGTLYIDGIISGTGVFTMSGSGQVILGGNNTFSSGMQINSGTASPRHNAAFGTGTVTCAGGMTIGGAFTVSPGGNYTLANAFVLTAGTTTVAVPFANGTDLNFSGVISGAGALKITSDLNGRLCNLINANTFSGGVTLGQGTDSGRVKVGNAASLGTGTLTVDQSGSNGLEHSTGVTLTNAIVINTGKKFNFGTGTGNMTLSGVISGAGSVVKNSTTTYTLSGANTYSGATTVSAGTLAAGVASVANTSGAFGNNSAVTTANVATAILNITGFNTQIGSLTGGGGTGGNVTLGAATLSVGGDNTSPAAYAGVISGTGALTKIGSGTLTLSGTNTYTGATTVSAGTLLFTGDASAATGAVSVASTATLGGTGTMGGAVTVASGGTLSPGVSSAATVTLSKASAAALTLQAGSTLAMTLGTASDRVTCSGASSNVVLGGTLAVTTGTGFAAGSYTLASCLDTISGSFSSITFSSTGYAATVVVDNVSTPRTATLAVTNFNVTARQTIDFNGNGKIDRIRITTGAANLNDDFSDLAVTVAGYTVTSIDTGLVANDGIFDVYVTESGSPDTSVTPVVQVLDSAPTSSFTSLQAQGTTSYLPVEGAGTAATDTAKPVLLSALYVDGGTNGVSGGDGDTLVLTFSENVTSASMVVGDLTLPVSGDTLSTSTIADKSTATPTITVVLAGTPLLSPGGTYASGTLGAGKPSGIYLSTAANLRDQATAPNTGLVGTVAADAVDIGASPSASISIEWNDTNDTVNKIWTLGTAALSTSYVSNTYTVHNIGYSTVALATTSSNSTSATTTWTVQSAVGADQFTMKADASTPLDAVYELTLSTSATTLAPFVRSGTTQAFKLQLSTPTTSSTAAAQAITVTITASQY